MTRVRYTGTGGLPRRILQIPVPKLAYLKIEGLLKLMAPDHSL